MALTHPILDQYESQLQNLKPWCDPTISETREGVVQISLEPASWFFCFFLLKLVTQTLPKPLDCELYSQPGADLLTTQQASLR